MSYDHKKIEKKWQGYWRKEKRLFQADDKSKKNKFYCLDMFPYPSGGGLHVGHVESYTATDIFSRYQRMKGKNVLHPQGWDAFGLPAENYAIKTKIHPSLTTKKAINTFKKQMDKMGFSYDWSREVNSSDPEYYKWTQWLFELFYKNGLAYRKKAKVNWCPSCQTVLANEQVENGVCERCGNEVMQKNLEQWFFKITDFIEDNGGAAGLINGLEKIDWPESTKAAQKNWIGKSEGAEFKLTIVPLTRGIKGVSEPANNFNPPTPPYQGGSISVYTTRLDTVYGMTYAVVAPEHEIILKLKDKIENYSEVEEYLIKAKNKTELERMEVKEKTGVELKGIRAINPFTKEEVPIFTADYVLGHYGIGAVMAVPAHDERDWEFARKYNLGIIEVIIPQNQNAKIKNQNDNEKFKILGKALTDDGVLVNSGKYSSLTSAQAREEMVGWLEENNLGNRKINYKIRDWLISRQRYWGAPIPIIYCDKCAKEKEQVLILHGWEDNSNSGFIPALRENLKTKGYETFAFDAPNTLKPNFNEWYKFIEEKIKENKLKNFHLVGHSMGGHLAAKLAEKYKLKSLLLVAPLGFSLSEEYFKRFSEKLSQEEMSIFKKYQDRKLDVKKVKKNTGSINIIFGAKDYWIEEEIRDYYIKNFKDAARIKVLDEHAHMAESEGVKRVEFLEDLFPVSTPGVILVPEKDLPVKLPTDVDFLPTGESPLARSKKFQNVKCPVCGAKARRESDTMDTFVCSSWYFFRYADPNNKKEFASPEMLKKWLPVDLYLGGAEHTVLHLLYARFFTKALHKLGYINFDEPFLKLRHQGIILAEDSRKMSKRWGNVINPDDVADEYGADSVRLYEMFMGPLEDMKPWNTKGIVGVRRFLERVWKLNSKIQDTRHKKNENLKIEKLLHKTIKKVSEDIENMKFNTAISAMMILLNEMEKEEEMPAEFLKNFLIILSPFAPHICEELWERLGEKESIFLSEWPKYDVNLIKDEEISLVLQVNGKIRDTILVSADIGEEEAKKLALENEKIKKWIEGKEVLKIIYVKSKIVNIVVK